MNIFQFILSLFPKPVPPVVKKTIVIDPGHGMGNKRPNKFDPGAVHNGIQEAQIVMDWTNELKACLEPQAKVIRTRIDHKDPAPIGKRAKIAKDYKGDIMISLHCNSYNGTASGTETFYRGASNRTTAHEINAIVSDNLNTVNRGAKTENASQHSRLAIMAFQPCFLIELGFIDHKGDNAKMRDPKLRRQTCEALAKYLTGI